MRNGIRQNKLADFAIQMYQSATTYNYNGSACNHGTFVQIAQSLTKIMPKFVDELATHYSKMKNVITSMNLGDLPDTEFAALRSAFVNTDGDEVSEALEWFMAEAIVAKNITAEQQKIFAVINHVFQSTIDSILPDLQRMPNGVEYETLISVIRNNEQLKDLIHEYQENVKAEITASAISPEVKKQMEAMKARLLAQEAAAKAAEEEEEIATQDLDDLDEMDHLIGDGADWQ